MAVLADGVLRVRLSEVVVFEAIDELCPDCEPIKTVAFWDAFPFGELILLLSNFELIIGGCDFTGILCTVSRVGPAIERVDLIGEIPMPFSSRSGTIWCWPLLCPMASFKLCDNETELAR